MTARNKAAVWKAAQRAVQGVTECQRCGAVSKVLQRHHPDYSKPTEVIVLCPRCHAAVHKKPPYQSTCVVCGKQFVAATHRHRAKLCSPECQSEYFRRLAKARREARSAANSQEAAHADL